MKQKIMTVLMVTLCCALAVSLYFNFKNPYLPNQKTEHLGGLTYILPEDYNWRYCDFDENNNGTFALEGETRKVISKGYIEMEEFCVASVEYPVSKNEGEYLMVDMDKKETAVKDGKNTITVWSGDYGEIPECVKRLRISTDGYTDEHEMNCGGTYWKALFEVNGVDYAIEVRNGVLLGGDVRYIGESMIVSVGYDKTLKDEFEKE